MYEPKDRAFKFRARARSHACDLHPITFKVFAPSGKQVLDHPFKGGGPSSYDATLPIAEDGESGVYRIEASTHVADIFRPMTELPAEIALVPNHRAISTLRTVDRRRSDRREVRQQNPPGVHLPERFVMGDIANFDRISQ